MVRSQPSLASLAFAAAPWIGARWAFAEQAPPPDPFLLGALVGCSVLFVLGARAELSARAAQLRIGGAALGTAALALPGLTDSPVLAMLWLAGLGALLIRVDERGMLSGESTLATRWLAARSSAQRAAAAALALWLFAIASGEPAVPTLYAVAWASGVSFFGGVSWLIQNRKQRLFAAPLAASMVLGLLAAWVSRESTWAALSAASVVPALFTLVLARSPVTADDDLWSPLFNHPARLPATTFLLLIVVGTVLLALPFAGAGGVSVNPLDAMFTAVSAVCVTGLTTVDTARAWSVPGQAVILLLIQVGGLGIMSLSTLTFGALGRRISMRHESALAGVLSAADASQLYGTARHLIRYTVVAEACGAAALTTAGLARGQGLGSALWEGVFTSISAFCNAGFGLRSDNLVQFAHEPWTLHVVAGLIVAGGISPAVVLGLPALLERSRPVPVQHRLVVGTTGALLVLGALLYLALEWDHSLAHLGVVDRLHNAWFQSATLRTAGFNSVDITQIHPATLFVMVSWMFIGGSPGGTAGGIKTTTLCVLGLAVVAAIRGQPNARVFDRSLPHRTVYRAAAIATIGVGFGLTALIALLATQHMPGQVALFEVVSALGTVGLSIGGTPLLDEIGKLIIMLCMFTGRIGPLTLFMLLNTRDEGSNWKYPEAEIDLG